MNRPIQSQSPTEYLYKIWDAYSEGDVKSLNNLLSNVGNFINSFNEKVISETDFFFKKKIQNDEDKVELLNKIRRIISEHRTKKELWIIIFIFARQLYFSEERKKLSPLEQIRLFFVDFEPEKNCDDPNTKHTFFYFFKGPFVKLVQNVFTDQNCIVNLIGVVLIMYSYIACFNPTCIDYKVPLYVPNEDEPYSLFELKTYCDFYEDEYQITKNNILGE